MRRCGSRGGAARISGGAPAVPPAEAIEKEVRGMGIRFDDRRREWIDRPPPPRPHPAPCRPCSRSCSASHIVGHEVVAPPAKLRVPPQPPEGGEGGADHSPGQQKQPRTSLRTCFQFSNELVGDSGLDLRDPRQLMPDDLAVSSRRRVPPVGRPKGCGPEAEEGTPRAAAPFPPASLPYRLSTRSPLNPCDPWPTVWFFFIGRAAYPPPAPLGPSQKSPESRIPAFLSICLAAARE